MTRTAPRATLTDQDLRAIAKARELAALTGMNDIIEHTGHADPGMASAVALGEAQVWLTIHADRAERLGGTGA